MTATDEHASDVGAGVVVIVAAYNEADRLGATLTALADAFPEAALWVADDGSTDGTAAIAQQLGARVVRSARMVGKGAAVTGAARAALEQSDAQTALLCDGDLGDSARRLGPLLEVVRHGQADMAVAAFSKRVGGGLGLALGFAGWAIRRRCGVEMSAPISGQRALRRSVLAELLPFAEGFGMEIGMTIDAVRAGREVVEIELDLAHRTTGKTIAGFRHRGAQLIDFVRVYLAKR